MFPSPERVDHVRQVLLEATADLQTPISPYWLRHAHDRGATLPQGQSDAGARQHRDDERLSARTAGELERAQAGSRVVSSTSTNAMLARQEHLLHMADPYR